FIAGQARDFDNARDISSLKATQDMATQKLAGDILISGERAAAAAALAGEKTAAAAALAGEKAAAASALESARLGSAIALGQAQLSKDVFESKYDLSKHVSYENEKTRDLINSLKNDDLNRLLIERNTDLQHCRHDYWGARDGLLNSQFAALSSQVNSQVNALNSQLSDTRQGMVNFGRITDVGQNATSNAVR
ncbi:MAG: hypothetical protein MUO40_00685, partial [Anaerolineaceae bacterium]|nr:hypothetical protein [Anaerolineaceae bacterium]